MEDESCRILTISSSASAALAFIDSVKALAASHSMSSDSPSPLNPSLESPSVPFTVPWTITNRYYTADVHFSAWTVEKLFAELFERQPPTVVFVWFDGEPYVEHITEVMRLMKLKDYEPEVALAVRIPAPDTAAAAPSSSSLNPQDKVNEDTVDADGTQDESDIDHTLMSYGFEYVDATRPFTKFSEGSRTDENLEDDIPALPRVLDALSTIMWPSMRSTQEGSGVRGREHLTGGRGLLDLNRSFDDVDSEDDELRQDRENITRELLREGDNNSLFEWEKKAGQTQGQRGDGDEEDQELMEQMKAFVMEAGRRKRERHDWISTSSSTTLCVSEVTMSPTDMFDTMSPFGTQPEKLNGELNDETNGTILKEKLSLRFEDDFTVFVSAPLPTLNVEQDKPTVNLTSFDSNGSLAPDAGFRYRSLGSVSDFGDGNDDDTGEGEGGYDPLEDAGSDGAGEDVDMPSKAEIRDTARKIFGSSKRSLDMPDDPGFDLGQVYGVLQGYKQEIAAMTDEEEKRKAAARVALGLVYGLEGSK